MRLWYADYPEVGETEKDEGLNWTKKSLPLGNGKMGIYYYINLIFFRLLLLKLEIMSRKQTAILKIDSAMSADIGKVELSESIIL